MESVRSWPRYFLWRIPPEIRAAISEEAQERDLSMAEVVRGVLCSYYGMDCEPVTLERGGMVGYDAARDKQHASMHLYLQPEVWDALQAEGAPRGMRQIVLGALEEHYAR